MSRACLGGPALPLLLLAAACGRGGGDQAPDPVAGTPVPCALAGAAAFRPVCTVERLDTPAGANLVVHRPDGGFRRLLVSSDGSGVTTADGAETARVTPVDRGTIEVAIGTDRYRLPATVRGTEPPPR